MTRKEYLDRIGILRCTLNDLDREVDDDFKSFISSLIREYRHIYNDDKIEEESDD